MMGWKSYSMDMSAFNEAMSHPPPLRIVNSRASVHHNARQYAEVKLSSLFHCMTHSPTSGWFLVGIGEWVIGTTIGDLKELS